MRRSRAAYIDQRNGTDAHNLQPDFLARAKAIWGEQPSGKLLSTVVAEARGGES